MRFAALLTVAIFGGLAFAAAAAAAVGILPREKTTGDFFVRSLPGQPDGPLPKMHAG